ncbi:unnamed protein product [Mycena citricolor]|uniref:Ebp2-domain-containing protein n=1 Tax=Mycena citricolor TaxID=2018698 RepID=A0AAD2H190_9AGAR|nr:unnamed protein product [Mycena citricolor]
MSTPSKPSKATKQKGKGRGPQNHTLVATAPAAGPSKSASIAPSEKSKKKAGKGKEPEPKLAPPPSQVQHEDEEDDEDEDDEDWVDEGADDSSDSGSEDEDEDDGIDEEGMARLMKALGDDGLDDMAHMELRALTGDEDSESGEEEDGDEEQGESSADASEDDAAHAAQNQDVDMEGAVDEDADIALDDAESVDADAVPRQKLEINNTVALERIRDTIKLDPSMSWTETLVVSHPKTIEVDVDDDLKRELAFYQQALDSVATARILASKHSLEWTRPADYFAEMVKSDSHMERIRRRLLDERAGIQKSEQARREREGKKFGKAVQVEKLKERERGRKEMEERVKGLKRKRGDMLDRPSGDDDGFDVAVEDAIADRPAKRGRSGAGPSDKNKKGIGRDARNKKFGFGGGGKHSKSNTRASTDSFVSGGGKGGKPAFGKGGKAGFGKGGKSGGGPKRLGKSRRNASKGK